MSIEERLSLIETTLGSLSAQISTLNQDLWKVRHKVEKLIDIQLEDAKFAISEFSDEYYI